MTDQSPKRELTPALIADLQTMDTPTVCNALELLVPE